MKIKICGLTCVDDARAAVDAGADWIGLNFHPPSPRFLDDREARAIVEAVGPRAETVGLFVNRPPEEVREVASRLGLGLVQLHGSEPIGDLVALRGLRVVRAFRIGDSEDLLALRDYAREAEKAGSPLHAVLADACVPGQFGGTGRSIDDDLIGPLSAMITDLPPLILAGGLSPENVADRIARGRPWMVDVAGGVESRPGRKDPSRMRAFVLAARGVAPAPGA